MVLESIVIVYITSGKEAHPAERGMVSKVAFMRNLGHGVERRVFPFSLNWRRRPATPSR